MPIMLSGRTQQRGSAFVETLIALPVLLAIAAGTLLYGLTFAIQQSLQHVTREVADAVLVIDPAFDGATTRIAAIADDRLSSLMESHFGVGRPLLNTVEVSTDAAIDSSSCGVSSGSQLCIVRSTTRDAVRQVVVRVDVPLSVLQPGLSAIALVPLPSRISAQSVVRYDSP